MKWLIVLLIFLPIITFSSPKVDKQAMKEDAATQRAVMLKMLKIRKIYVLDPHRFWYVAPARLRKGIAKSECLTLDPDASRADAILAPIPADSSVLPVCQGSDCSEALVTEDDSNLRWVLLDPKTMKRISGWSMFLPRVKNVEKAVGCPK